jgi:hypothetical protein
MLDSGRNEKLLDKAKAARSSKKKEHKFGGLEAKEVDGLDLQDDKQISGAAPDKN